MLLVSEYQKDWLRQLLGESDRSLKKEVGFRPGG
jgi:hypothetical protein